VRYTRQELKQDRFAETAADAMHWTVAHRSKLVSGGIAIGVLLIVLLGGFWYVRHTETTAASELGHALAIYNAPLRPAEMPPDPQQTSFTSIKERAQAASNEFNKIASSYGFTRSGKYAKYFAGLAAIDMDNDKVAEEHLKYTAGVRDADISSLSKFALAALYRGTNREAEAIAKYKELIDHPTNSVPKVTAQLQLADLYSAKQPAEAKKIYEQIAKDNPKSPLAEMATSKSQQLK
jgi:predicted negative regulator of RcsB-dependent stress response